MTETIDLGLDDARQAVEDAGLCSSLCTIKNKSGALDSAGQPDLTNASATPVTGMVDIACMASPEVLQRPDITDERKGILDTLARMTRHVLLNGHYPAITQAQVATIDGVDYDIMSAESDSQAITTRLAVQRKVL